MLPNCPAWHDADEHTSPECFRVIQEVVTRARAEARSQLPTTTHIRSWHLDAFKNVVPIAYYAGNFRQEDAARICLGNDVEVGGLAGSHYRHVAIHMEQLLDHIRGELASLEAAWPGLDSTARVQRLARTIGTAIARFVHIHPFINGNGRTSRVLWAALLSRVGLPPQASVLRRPGYPYGDVMRAAMQGDYAPAITMVLVALAKTPASPTVP